eukprot:TRINITY_DN4024_c0_g1_i1.p1 TRINITY_DN4024_c0_g1~~TRINITY_DN4024_c0_g1_i1.p1  ORF type:complete len:437 (-),score=126.53 TRINITY_DN4024_c0_g1_i1:26-1336(-)
MGRAVVILLLAVLIGLVCVEALPYGKESSVMSLTDNDFVEKVFATQKVTIVEFYAPWCGHCKSLAPHYEKAAENLKGIIQVAAIDCDQHKGAAGQFGIKGFPTIKVFGAELEPDTKKKGAFIKTPTDYNGPRTAKGIVDYALSLLHARYIQKVTSSNVESILDFNNTKLSPPGAPRVLLFTNKKESSNLYKSLSMEYKGRAVFGEVRDKEKALLETYSITTFPQVLILTGNQPEPIRFDKSINYDNLHAFIEGHALPNQLKAKPAGSSAGGKQKSDKKATPPPPPPPPEKIELVELLKQEDFEKNCLEKKGICVISFLPSNTSDPEGLASYLKVLQGLVDGGKFGFRWLWVDGELYSAFKDGFVPNADLPRLVAYSPAKKRLTLFTSSFTTSNIESFLERVMTGRAQSVAVEKTPFLPAEPLPKPTPLPIEEDLDE